MFYGILNIEKVQIKLWLNMDPINGAADDE